MKLIKPRFKRFEDDLAVSRFVGDVENAFGALIDSLPKSFKRTGTMEAGMTTVAHNLCTTDLIVCVNPPSVTWGNLTPTSITLFSTENTSYTLLLLEVK